MKRDEEYKTRLASAVVKANVELLGNLIAASKITIDDAVKASGYSKKCLDLSNSLARITGFSYMLSEKGAQMKKRTYQKEMEIAAHYEAMTEAEAEKEHRWAVKNGSGFPTKHF